MTYKVVRRALCGVALSKKKQIGTVDARKAIEGVLSHYERA